MELGQLFLFFSLLKRQAYVVARVKPRISSSQSYKSYFMSIFKSIEKKSGITQNVFLIENGIRVMKRACQLAHENGLRERVIECLLTVTDVIF